MSSRPARIRGQMLLRPDGYPALVVERHHGLGGRDYAADRRRSVPLAFALDSGLAGELHCLERPDECMALLDEFEGFFPGRPSEYLRVLLPVACEEPRLAWVYVAAEADPAWVPIASWPPVGAPRTQPYRHGLA